MKKKLSKESKSQAFCFDEELTVYGRKEIET